uniref:Uncharacterized protein n=1 Tax=Caenorhabditis japonica TaxID=281687 RepID=A0A8R1IRX2_CAEJA
MTAEKVEIMRKPIFDNSGNDSDVSFVGGLYWSIDANGVTHYNIRDCIGTIGLSFLM